MHTSSVTGLNRMRRTLVPTAAIVVILAVWQFVCATGIVPGYMLPSPVAVVLAFGKNPALLLSNTLVTLQEAALGLVIGVTAGFIFAVGMDRFLTFRLALNPLITVSQTIPTIAIAPLLVLWFGYGLAPKVILVVITTFFPITVSLVSGFASVDPDLLDLMRTMRASRSQVFWNVKLPAALPQFFSGLKISATYAIVGAVVAEWIGSSVGIGHMMTLYRKSFAYDSMFAVILLISALSLLLMKLVDAIEHVAMPWEGNKGRKDQS